MFSSLLRNQARRMLSNGCFPSRLATPLHHHHHHRLSANLPSLSIFNPLRFSSTSRTLISSAYTRALLNHQQKPESLPVKSEKTPENIPKISIVPSLSCLNQPMKETLVSRNLNSKEKSVEEWKKINWEDRLKKNYGKTVCEIIGVLTFLVLLRTVGAMTILAFLLMPIFVMYLAVAILLSIVLSIVWEVPKDFLSFARDIFEDIFARLRHAIKGKKKDDIV